MLPCTTLHVSASCNNLTSLKDLRTCECLLSLFLFTELTVAIYATAGHKLTELYVRRNQLSDYSELDHLTTLPNLTVSPTHKSMHIHCTVCYLISSSECIVCVCVREREREIEGGNCVIME